MCASRSPASPANRVDARDYRHQQGGRRPVQLGTLKNDPTHFFAKKTTFYAFQKTPIFHQFSVFLEALQHKGFTEQVFGKLLSQQKNNQKERLLAHPAARSHQFPGRSCFRLLGSPDGICLDTRIAGLRRELAHHQIGCVPQYRFCGHSQVGLKVSSVFPSICHLGIQSKKESSHYKRGLLCLFRVRR